MTEAPAHRLTDAHRSEDDLRDMRGSRGTAVAGACAVLGLMALSAPGWAASPPRRHAPRQVNVALTGGLTITWTGNAADGCAAVGVCGVSGSLELHLGNSSESSVGGPVPLEVSDSGAVARVQTTAPDGTVLTCADLVPVDFNLAVRHGGGGAPRTTMDPATSIAPPSAGRCAGPTAADLRGLDLPARPFGAHGYDMSGRSSFTGGPFQVTVFSTVRAHITYGSGGTQPPLGGGSFFGSAGGTTTAGPGKARSVLEESATVVYRMTGFSGALTTGFGGVAEPLCDALGACGAAGRLVQSFDTRGTLSFSGTRLVPRPRSARAALADLRRGRLQLYDSFPASFVHVSTDEALSESHGVTCNDTSRMRLNSMASRAHGATDELILSPSPRDFPIGQVDPFRTRCPGPSAADILGSGGTPMAAGVVTAGRLGDQRLSVAFSTRGPFTGSAYSGQRSGSVVLSLTLVRRRGTTRRVKLFRGEPPFPLR